MLVNAGQVDVKYVESSRNIADIFTKPLSGLAFTNAKHEFGLRN